VLEKAKRSRAIRQQVKERMEEKIQTSASEDK
jgi:hypothetical protein